MTLSPLEGFKIFYDMHLQRVIKGEKEKELSSYNSERIGGKVRPMWCLRTKKEALKKKELLPWRRKRRRFPKISKEKSVKGLSNEFPKLFINGYS